MSTAVLDASALLALLLAEPGGETVRAVLADAAISAVNFSEVIGHYVRNGVAEAQIRQVLDPLPLDIVPFDLELAYVAGLLLPATRSAGLSLGDRACLARTPARLPGHDGGQGMGRHRGGGRSRDRTHPVMSRRMTGHARFTPVHQSLTPGSADFPAG
jgi:ribonuclease VapC